tara:strand:+ start:1336 stop:1782 length:447 start_codon:yes stop_codon:yes gene_type:complete
MKNEIAQALIRLVENELGVPLKSTSRARELIDARSICYQIMRDEMGMSYNYIGTLFNKNHATIISAVKKFPDLIKYDKGLERTYNKILNMWALQAGDFVDLTPLEIKIKVNCLVEQNKLLNLSLIDVQEKFEKRLAQIEYHLNHKNEL